MGHGGIHGDDLLASTANLDDRVATPHDDELQPPAFWAADVNPIGRHGNRHHQSSRLTATALTGSTIRNGTSMASGYGSDGGSG
jgi:hypothetical protein